MRHLILVTLFAASPAVAVSNAAIDDAAKGGITGLAMGLIAGIAIVVWKLVAYVKNSVVPKAVDMAKTGIHTVSDTAKDFQNRNKVCPFCAETIKREAVVCKHCNRSL